jgi:hypothetical protein
MNKRIKELAEQCWDRRLDGVHFNQEMFAELIVKECLAQADALRDALESDGEDQQSLGADWVGLAISRHFGVE